SAAIARGWHLPSSTGGKRQARSFSRFRVPSSQLSSTCRVVLASAKRAREKTPNGAGHATAIDFDLSPSETEHVVAQQLEPGIPRPVPFESGSRSMRFPA